MDGPEQEEEIASHIARRKVASEGVKRVHRLLDIFATNNRANRRIAVIGITVLLVFIIGVVLNVTVFDDEIEPDYVVIGKILQLKIDGEIDDPGNRGYSAQVALETGEVVWANIDWKIYSLFEKDHIVEVGYFSGVSGNKYEIIIGRMPNAP